MKQDVKKFLKQFTLLGIKIGDLVLTGEVSRVVKTTGWAKGSIEVVSVESDCEVCKRIKKKECCHAHIVRIGLGQQAVMKLKKQSK